MKRGDIVHLDNTPKVVLVLGEESIKWMASGPTVLVLIDGTVKNILKSSLSIIERDTK